MYLETVRPAKRKTDNALSTQDEEAHPSKVFSSRSLVYQPDIPRMPVRATPKDENTPEMPTLESFLSSSLCVSDVWIFILDAVLAFSLNATEFCSCGLPRMRMGLHHL